MGNSPYLLELGYIANKVKVAFNLSNWNRYQLLIAQNQDDVRLRHELRVLAGYDDTGPCLRYLPG